MEIVMQSNHSGAASEASTRSCLNLPEKVEGEA
jgi:hypothetical protein